MDRKTLVSRLEIAHDLGVQPQTIAHWERSGWFPRPKRMLSMKRIYYDRAEVREALAKRARRLGRLLRMLEWRQFRRSVHRRPRLPPQWRRWAWSKCSLESDGRPQMPTNIRTRVVFRP